MADKLSSETGMLLRSVAVWFSKFSTDGLAPTWVHRRISFDVHIPKETPIGLLPISPRKMYTLEVGTYKFRGLVIPLIPVPATIFTKT